MTLLVVYALIALGISFLCSLLEAVLLSTTPSFVEARARQSPSWGRHLRALKADVDRPLAAILSLNTIAHTVGAAGVGAQAAHVWGSAALGVASAILTLLILVLSELIPKTLGARYWRQLAAFTTRAVLVMIWILWPLVALSQRITRTISGGHPTPHRIDRDEIHVLADIGTQEGGLEPDEASILQSILRLHAVRTADIMTPRTVMRALPEHTTISSVLDNRSVLQFSRLPVYEEHQDHITGYVLKDELLLQAARDDPDRRLATLRREIVAVPDTLPVPQLFSQLIGRSEHIALVLDEYGGTAGIVTMEDVVETMLGLEIVDEMDLVEDMQALAREHWYRRARRLGLVPEEETDAAGPGE